MKKLTKKNHPGIYENQTVFVIAQFNHKKGSLRRTFTSHATKKKKLVTKHVYEEFSISVNFAIIVTQSLKAFIYLCKNKI